MTQKIACLASVLVLLIALPIVVANAAPPGARLLVQYDGKVLTGNFSAEFLICRGQDYSPEREIIPQLDISEYDANKGCYWKPFAAYRWGVCKDGTCDFFPVPYGKTRVAAYVPALDKVFITEEVSADVGMNSYLLDLLPDGAASISRTRGVKIEHNQTEVFIPAVPPDKGGMGFIVVFLLSLVITLVIELPVAWAYTASRTIKGKARKRVLLSVLYANLLSVPLFWIGIYLFSNLDLFAGPIGFIGLEAGVMVFEAYLINRWNAKTMTFRHALVLSVLMNLVSVLLPLLFLMR